MSVVAGHTELLADHVGIHHALALRTAGCSLVVRHRTVDHIAAEGAVGNHLGHSRLAEEGMGNVTEEDIAGRTAAADHRIGYTDRRDRTL